ncbi:MAG: LysR family transcriptional regulator [Armatimonadetes bacterium]|nr:LysR family transcriptional regulator [Anaerolineae bacterium]
MELRQLRSLIALADEGNFTRAAEKVFITQSALSQQIQALEQEIGTPLVDRSKRGVQLTAAGEILCRHGRRSLHEMAQARIAIGELSDLKRGTLLVGAVQTVNHYLMPSIIAAFATQYPDIVLRVEELAADAIEQQLEEGDLQVGVSFTPPSDAMLAAETLFEEQLMLVVRADHPLARQASVNVSALHAMPMVMLTHTFCTRRLWEASARLASAQPKVVLELNTVSGILAAVAKTGLPTVLPALTLQAADNNQLVGVALCHPTPARQVGLLWRRDGYVCAASRAFMALAHTTVQASLETGVWQRAALPEGA